MRRAASGVPGTSKTFSRIRRYRGPFQKKMTRKEAALILNVKQQSTEKDIKKAHRKIMLLNHPDRGGSKFLATKINEGKIKGRREDELIVIFICKKKKKKKKKKTKQNKTNSTCRLSFI